MTIVELEIEGEVRAEHTERRLARVRIPIYGLEDDRKGWRVKGISTEMIKLTVIGIQLSAFALSIDESEWVTGFSPDLWMR